MNPRIGISLGDVTGVGPEVTLKAISELIADKISANFNVVGDTDVVRDWNQRLGLGLDLSTQIRILDPCGEDEVAAGVKLSTLIEDAHEQRLPLGSAAAARAAVNWIREGARLCLTRELDALVTAPVNKHAIVQAGIPFTGHTEMLSEIAGEARTIMMLLGPDEKDRWLRVALATVHIAIRDVPAELTTDKVLLAIQRAAQACHDLGLERPCVGVCGLNPHAGEGGVFGDEEPRIIEPAIHQARAQGLNVIGPLPGDTVFHQALHGEYDAVVAMYHDQGLAPLKLAAFNTGVNWTLGLPFIRTSPDHGTAYNIAGKGIADPTSMISALRLAVQLAEHNEDRRRRPSGLLNEK